MSNCDVNTECTVTLCQAVKATTSGGQGFFRCDCGNGKKQCQTNRCKCFKAGKFVIADATAVLHVRINSSMNIVCDFETVHYYIVLLSC